MYLYNLTHISFDRFGFRLLRRYPFKEHLLRLMLLWWRFLRPILLKYVLTRPLKQNSDSCHIWTQFRVEYPFLQAYTIYCCMNLINLQEQLPQRRISEPTKLKALAFRETRGKTQTSMPPTRASANLSIFPNAGPTTQASATLRIFPNAEVCTNTVQGWVQVKTRFGQNCLARTVLLNS